MRRSRPESRSQPGERRAGCGRLVACAALGLAAAALPRFAHADEAGGGAAPGARPHLIGYVETHYTYALGRPANRVIAQRGFDNRHATFMLSNAMLGVAGEGEVVHGRLALQVGATPATYYQAEPGRPAEGGAGALDASLWRHVQEAFAGWRPLGGRGPVIEAGVFLSQIGIEPLAVREADHWSRSNLFYGLPFYHTGLRVEQPLGHGAHATLAVYNGWNSVLDNNPDKSLSARLAHAGPRHAAALLYFGGVERAAGDPAGTPWRHLFDAWAWVEPWARLRLAAQGNLGWERGPLGLARWHAAALYARAQLTDELVLGVRGDGFVERALRTAGGTRHAIFWPADRIASLTATLSYLAAPSLRVYAECRRDAASEPAFFRGAVSASGGVAQPNARTQATVTAGMVWGL